MSWYEVIALMRNYLMPYLQKEYGSGTEFLSAVNGMNCFLDISMGIIGEAYVHEKNGIIEANQEIINKQNEELEQKVIERTTQLENTIQLLKEYQHFFYKNNDLCVMANNRGYFVTVNPSLEKILGYTEKELTEVPFFDFINPDDIAATGQAYENQQSEGKEVVSFLNRIRKKDGSYVYIDWNSTPDPVTGNVYAIGRDITERKKIEDQLQDSNELFSKIFNNNPSIMVISNLHDGTIKDINHQFLKAFGLISKEEAIGKTAVELNVMYHPEQRAEMINSFSENKTVDNFELNFTTRQNELRCLNASISEIVINNIPYVLSAAIDITDRKKAEQELVVIAQKLNEAQALAHVGNWDVNLITGISTWSEETYRILGLSKEDTVPSVDLFLNSIHPDDALRVKETVDGMFSNLKSVNFGCRIKRPDGTIVYAFSESTIDFDSSQKPLRLFGTLQDITEIEKTQEQLAETSHKLNEAQALAHIGNWGVDLTTNTINCSDELYNICGLNKNETTLSFELFLSFVHPDDLAFVNEKIYGMLKDFKTVNLIYRIIKTDGTIRWVDAQNKVDLDTNGSPMRFYGVCQDITERKKVEEQLQAVNKELETFSYSVSHDLRAPLRAINGFSKILQEDYASILDADGISFLDEIMNNTKRMGTLIDDLLTFSRLGRKEILTSEINMTALVKSVKEEVLTGYTGTIKFLIHVLPSAKGDPALIRQVWVNLISNAIKYSQHKSKSKVEIGSYIKGSEIVFFIKDNGVGFNMQYYDKLFGVFQRLHSQEEFEGTGVGLAIVEKIINRHNGRVWAESKLNEGSCFYFSLQ